MPGDVGWREELSVSPVSPGIITVRGVAGSKKMRNNRKG